MENPYQSPLTTGASPPPGKGWCGVTWLLVAKIVTWAIVAGIIGATVGRWIIIRAFMTSLKQ